MVAPLAYPTETFSLALVSTFVPLVLQENCKQLVHKLFPIIFYYFNVKKRRFLLQLSLFMVYKAFGGMITTSQINFLMEF